MDSIDTNIANCLESVLRNCDNCTDNQVIMKNFKGVSQELDELDEKLTIIRVTISSTNFWSVELLEDVLEVNKYNQNNSKNYLLEKLQRKLASVQREGTYVKLILTNLKLQVKELAKTAKDLVLKVSSCHEGDMMKTFKEVKKELGVLDVKLTMLRSEVTSCIELVIADGDQKPYEVKDNVDETLKTLGLSEQNVDIIPNEKRNNLERSVSKITALGENMLDVAVIEAEVEKVFNRTGRSIYIVTNINRVFQNICYVQKLI